ncbi:MAG: hypothetical protein AABX55_02385 [Nanoarchaeota archaeon]
MDKKGVELSFNVIIIAILVILVLVIVGYFFTTGAAGLFKLFGGLAPDDRDVAVTSCSSKCQLAQQFGTENQKASSSYCRNTWKIDTNNDGKIDTDAEGNVIKYHCWDNAIGETCPGVQEFCQEV